MAESVMRARMSAGLAAAAVAVGVMQCLAAFFPASADARNAVGSAVIDMTPGPVKEWAIQTFGTADKLFLSVTVLVVIGIFASVAAVWERTRVPVGSLAILIGATLGTTAVLSRPGATPVDVLPTVVGALCGVVVLRLLTSKQLVDAPNPPSPTAPLPGPPPPTRATDQGRRRSLAMLGFFAAGTLTGVIGSILGTRRRSVSDDRITLALPDASTPAPPIPPQVQPRGVDLPSFITTNDDFYRIDTALSVPQLSRKGWKLRIHGMVDRELTYTFEDLEKFEPIETTVTLTCVSNPVGGNLISTAVWTGYRIHDLLRASGIRPDADMVLSTSIDGFTVGTPVEALTDGRTALLAIGMNGEPLPVEHGYPARLVVAGLYGFVSATKWVVDLELTRFDRASAYWTQLGWSERAPIKTESRIDVPQAGAEIASGPFIFGGIAWAQNRGIKAVEVSVDDGKWQPAELGAAYSKDTWRLWSFRWDATVGRHTVSVRATDNTGELQTSTQVGPVPDGATGWHAVTFDVR